MLQKASFQGSSAFHYARSVNLAGKGTSTTLDKETSSN